ncbi:S8 family serine peptidase [Pseudoalteromonas umbrosa]|uniref:S8 family serine peptidase n=1 Tax=Pseudoalteromonas umbrosa TaxID=3048489 RepID=UPI0024C362CD|nr:S8 family serine peptidase [Pseudoalteromonas sp. B95]MDK1286364.1 S8 family serine peptidase [Pseudoalteromonas sp. B95]
MIDRVISAGILIIAEAGNYDSTSRPDIDAPLYPAAYRSVMSVGAVDENKLQTRFSPVNPILEICALGSKTLSTIDSTYREINDFYYQTNEGVFKQSNRFAFTKVNIGTTPMSYKSRLEPACFQSLSLETFHTNFIS